MIYLLDGEGGTLLRHVRAHFRELDDQVDELHPVAHHLTLAAEPPALHLDEQHDPL